MQIKWLNSFEEVHSNMRWDWPHLAAWSRYAQYGDDNLDELFSYEPANWVNGLLHFTYQDTIKAYASDGTLTETTNTVDTRRSIVRVPMFSQCTSFHRGGTLGVPPVFLSPNAARQAWLDLNKDEIYKALLRAFKHWPETGNFVLAVERTPAGLYLRDVDPRNYFKVVDIRNPENVVGHVLAWPWRQVEPQVDLQTHHAQPDDRLTVVKLAPDFGVNERTEYEYSAGGIGQALAHSAPSEFVWVAQFGQDRSLYEGAEQAVQQICVLKSFQAMVQYVWGFPTVALPHGAPNQWTHNPRGSVVRRDAVGDGGEHAEYLQLEDNHATWEALLRQHWNTAHEALKIPPSVTGVDNGGATSGIMVARMQADAKQQALELRQHIIRVLPEVIDALDPANAGAEMTIEWPVEPYVSQDPLPHLFELVQNGVITPEEARPFFGFEARETPADSNEGSTDDQRSGQDA